MGRLFVFHSRLYRVFLLLGGLMLSLPVMVMVSIGSWIGELGGIHSMELKGRIGSGGV